MLHQALFGWYLRWLWEGNKSDDPVAPTVNYLSLDCFQRNNSQQPLVIICVILPLGTNVALVSLQKKNVRPKIWQPGVWAKHPTKPSVFCGFCSPSKFRQKFAAPGAKEPVCPPPSAVQTNPWVWWRCRVPRARWNPPTTSVSAQKWMEKLNPAMYWSYLIITWL